MHVEACHYQDVERLTSRKLPYPMNSTYSAG